MSDDITLTGVVATTPRHLVTSEGVQITSFRLASSQRHLDAGKGEWVETDTNWYTVVAFRDLAVNLVGSVQKGHRVVVAGRLRIRNWETEDKSGTTVEVEAATVGHDLRWGETQYTRTRQVATAPTDEPAAG